MKYMLKKIIIGVSIGMILFYCKSCNVYAATTYNYLYNATNVVVNYDVDVCKFMNQDLLCVNGFTGQKTLNRGNGSIYIKENNNDNLALKSFSLSATFANNVMLLYRYASLNNNLSSLIYSSNQYGALINTKLNYNQYLSYVKITTQDDTECIATNVGATYQSTSGPYPYFQVPSACRGKYVKQIDIIWQSGYNYSGSSNIIDFMDDTGTLEEKISKNRNNTYLAFIPSGHSFLFNGYVGNIQLYSSSTNTGGYGSTNFDNEFTQIDSEIQQNLSDLNKQILIGQQSTSVYMGQDELGNSNKTAIDETVNLFQNQVDDLVNDQYNFRSFLNALILGPINKLQESQNRYHNYGQNNEGEDITTPNCPQYTPQIKLWPYKDGNTWYNYTVQLPCMSDLYLQFVSHNGYGVYQLSGLAYILKIIYNAFFAYLLVITYVNTLKGAITPKNTEIEVLEL